MVEKKGEQVYFRGVPKVKTFGHGHGVDFCHTFLNEFLICGTNFFN